jgi:DNA-binding NarL/FixJ family response regulator
MSIRVLVADDQSMVRAGFRMLLAREPDIDVVAEAGNGHEAVHQAARFDPTVVLMDIRMPQLDGLEATRRILAANDLARILILTTFDLDEYVYEALSAGASGTVKTHVTHVLQKLNLRDRVQAVVLAYQTGIVDTETRRPIGRDQSGAV